MSYTTREISISIPNTVRGASITIYKITSEQWYETADGDRYIDLALNEGRWESPDHDKLIGDMVFTLDGSYLKSGGGVLGYPKTIVDRRIGRYKSLEDALATLRDMGVIDQDAMKTLLERYVEGE